MSVYKITETINIDTDKIKRVVCVSSDNLSKLTIDMHNIIYDAIMYTDNKEFNIGFIDSEIDDHDYIMNGIVIDESKKTLIVSIHGLIVSFENIDHNYNIDDHVVIYIDVV